ncbi:MAG: cystathionine beta-lyase/cystathionine gamma-synthase, partial [Flavobacteriales bacterium]
MRENKMLNYVGNVLENMPADWLNLTTHRLDIYDEKLAKVQFLDQFKVLFEDNIFDSSALRELPTAFDYIRLGHPLSCLLEWAIADMHGLKAESAISFSSKTIPVFAVLRKNLLDSKSTQIVYSGELPEFFDAAVLKSVYGYKFDLKHVEKLEEIPAFDGSTVFISQQDEIWDIEPT